MSNGRILTNKMAYELFKKNIDTVFHDVSFDYGIKIEAYNNESVHWANTSTDFHDTLNNSLHTVLFGYKEFYENPDDPVNLFDFVGGFVSIYHEKEHVDQKIRSFTSKDSVSRILTMNSIACNQNEGYYHQNYWSDPREIDAQYEGLIGAYCKLSELYGSKNADKMVTYYQNKRLSMGRDYIPNNNGKPYHNVSEIFDTFDHVLTKSLHAQREYDIYADDAKSDKSAEIFGSSRLGMQYYDQFCNEPDGVKQNLMVGTLFTGANEYFVKHVKKNMKSVSNVSFTIQHAFDKPDIIDRMIDKRAEMSEGRDLQKLREKRSADISRGINFETGSDECHFDL